ncbi:hypothetical protein Vadar_023119 [Vaccinium darrowii]|uniref:Uncharacterized protein n=1 Tax=Vaccinium darrowii TaxID=229202 RepID=A0ACB7X394_9ERIC|nr:hypothetical protein Vadar_023119 [Vaccinium darrowii]
MGSFFEVHFDFMNDERTARRLKRKCVRNKESKVNNSFSHSLKRVLEYQKLGGGMVDEDYLCFLNHLAEDFKSRNSENHLAEDFKSRNSIVQDNDESGDDDDDPHYKMFLDKVKVDGKSYVLEVAVKNEVPFYIKYEAEDTSDDELELPIMRKWTSAVDIESSEAAKDLRMETRKNLTNLGREDVTDSLKSMRNRVGSETMGLVVENDMAPEPLNHVSGKGNGFSSEKHCPKDSHLINADSERCMEVDLVDECYQFYLNGIKGEADSPRDSVLIEVDSEHEMDVDLVDDSYQMYLDGIKGEADSTTEDAKPVKSEKMDDESSSDSDVLMALNASDFYPGNYSPFETSKRYFTLSDEDDQHCLGNPNTSNHSGFREKLMDKLRESFDHEEYEKLWQDITEQRLKERLFNFRSGVIKSCKKFNEPGPSYLEQYPVLEDKIDAVKFDKCKVLNLLRGFFFWLQNLVQKDAFPPCMPSPRAITMADVHLGTTGSWFTLASEMKAYRQQFYF